MKNKFKIAGLWIPYQILTDKNLSDKENHKIFGVTKNQISRIVNSLNKKRYTFNDYFYKNNHKEILYRRIIPIRKNDDTYCEKVQDKYYQKVQQDILENVIDTLIIFNWTGRIWNH